MMLASPTRFLFAVSVGLSLIPPMALADPYRLVMGDRVIVDYDFLETPKETAIDLDGQIRLAEIGSIAAAGNTLDEVEAAIAQGMTDGGFAVVSFVSVEIAEYAPVVVSGFVAEAGRYDFIPGMTVGAAVAVAGGVGQDEATGPNIDTQIFAANRRADEAADGLVRAAVTISGLEANLAGPDTPVELSETVIEVIPTDRMPNLQVLLNDEAARLQADRQRAATLLASWDQEIADFATQATLLDRRIVLKQEAIQAVENEIAEQQSLRDQGLATTARMLNLQQRLADDREELLTFEIAQVQAGRNKALAERNRADFLATATAEDLRLLATTRDELTAARREYDRSREEALVLGSRAADLELLDDSLQVRFRVDGPRADRFGDGEITSSAPLMPGDILVVELVQAP